MVKRLDDAKAFPADASTEEKKAMTLEAYEAALLSGRWNGTEMDIQVSIDSSGIFTLPRYFLTCKAIRVGGLVRDMASPWYTFLQHTSDLSQWSTNVQDLGDGFCVFKQPDLVNHPEGAKLRFICIDDNTTTVEVHGTDASGLEIYTLSDASQRGALLTFNAAKAAPYFFKVTDLIKPKTTARGELKACYDDNTEEIIGLYDPSEEVPSYRQYLIQEAQLDPTTTTAVVARVQLRPLPWLEDTDVFPISNLRAMKKLVRHIHFENESDETRSGQALSDGIKFLNFELKQLRAPGERGSVRVDAQFFGAQGLYQMK